MTISDFPAVSSVAICGAGMAGLALATLLARRGGSRPIVFEARSEDACRTEGAFVTIAPNGIAALRALCIDPGWPGAGLRHGLSRCATSAAGVLRLSTGRTAWTATPWGASRSAAVR